MPRKIKALLLLAPASLLCAAASSEVALSPGLWQIMNTPGQATLDGRNLTELPLSVLKPERICLSPAQARDPATFLPGDIRPDCRITESTAAAGKLRIRAVCPGEGGFGDATLSLDGRFDKDDYEVRFETASHGDNGRMTFSGKLTGRRIGKCRAPKRR